ncbi:MAG TPA: YbaK/EbsC family protein [Candidatus Nanoarchaeia archaeon]|nr:YbaK/EbsC family protein [Candidatus Nanoarchaeia archaeon]
MNILSSYLEQHSVKAEILCFDQSTRTCADAAALLNVPLSSIVKTVILIDDQKRTLAAIIPGNKRVDLSKICAELGLKRVRIAPPEEVFKRTGYEAGAVPPLGFQALFILDAHIKGEVYAGGGTTNSLLKIHVKELERMVNPVMLDVSKHE